MRIKQKWRPCPLGEYWKRAHPRKGTKGVKGHCVTNPSRKDQIYSDELEYIAEKYFNELSGPPVNKTLGYSQGNKYDKLIRGWCKYWNDIYPSNNPLDPNLVKALIATESGFRTTIKIKDGKGQGYATGLMQVTDSTQKILSNENGELKNHLVNVDQKELENPNLNIAAGIRWLFRKNEIASSKLGRDATWDEAIMVYKGYKDPNHDQMIKLRNLYKRLKDE